MEGKQLKKLWLLFDKRTELDLRPTKRHYTYYGAKDLLKETAKMALEQFPRAEIHQVF